ncbi:MAG: XTP/dITP diphosphatase [Calditrichia bacterium]
MREIVIATANQHKLEEIREILKGLPRNILSIADFPEIGEIEETGTTFEENALIKAREVFRHTGLLTLADDSGLEVDALNGEPGVYSARYSGKGHDYAANNQKLLQELAGVPPAHRGAQFRCVVAIVGPKIEKTVSGVVRGTIIEELRGKKGFGYDPLFVPEGFHQTFAELGETVKNRISHRARAFTKARQVLEEYFGLSRL